MMADDNGPVQLSEDQATGDRFLVYSNEKGMQLDVRFEGETLWMTQAQIGELFGRDRTTITRHINNILEEGELDETTYVQKTHISLGRPTTVYNLDMVISVGYRVSSAQATAFRRWATGILVQFAKKGFVVDAPSFIPQTFTTHSFHKDWLKTTAIVVGSSAPVLFLGSMAVTAEPARFLIDFITWPLGTVTFAAQETRFLSAITAGFLLGWAVMIWCLRAWVYDAAPEGVRKSVVVGCLAWFVLDSVGVVLAGSPINVAFNLAVLLFAVGPLWWPAQKNNQESKAA